MTMHGQNHIKNISVVSVPF